MILTLQLLLITLNNKLNRKKNSEAYQFIPLLGPSQPNEYNFLLKINCLYNFTVQLFIEVLHSIYENVQMLNEGLLSISETIQLLNERIQLLNEILHVGWFMSTSRHIVFMYLFREIHPLNVDVRRLSAGTTNQIPILHSSGHLNSKVYYYY